MINRLVLLLSLLGMVLALHLWIQKERNFDQGCWGVGAAASASAADGCSNSELRKVSELLGVSVATWGYLFYFFVATMALAKVLLPPRAASVCHTMSDVAVAFAFPYSGYLVFYQAAVAKAFCPLCLVSGGFVATIFVLHVVQYRRGGFSPVPEDKRTAEIGYAAGMSFIAMGMLAAVMIFVNHVGTRRFDEGANAKQFVSMVGQSLPTFIDAAKLQEMKPVRLDYSVRPLRPEEWTTDEPAKGIGKVNVIVFLDPNCPSCKGTFANVEKLAERHGDQAAFYVLPRVLWDFSLLQSQALELAKPTGKYFEMWRLQLDRQKRGGLGVSEIRQLFADLQLDASDLEARLANVHPKVVARRDRAQQAEVNGTPSIFINGIAVDGLSRDERSLSLLIEQAAKEGGFVRAAPPGVELPDKTELK